MIVSADVSPSIDSDAAQVSIQNVTFDPQILMQGDTGNVIIQVHNTGNRSVAIRSAELFSNDLKILNDQTYESVGTLGPGNTMPFTFTIRASSPDGTYFLKFYLDFLGPGSLRYYIPVTIESSKLQISLVDAPDVFSQDKKDLIQLTIGNPRDNEANGVVITPEGKDIKTTQSSVFIGQLDPNIQKNVTLEITPEYNTKLVVSTQYRNGKNIHYTNLTIPVETGTQKIRAEPVLDNLVICKTDGYYSLKGDITNIGLEEADGTVVSVGAPASSIDSNPLSVIGDLLSGDSSSFKLSVTCQNTDNFPFIIQFKDPDGNQFTTSTRINLTGKSSNTATLPGELENNSTNSSFISLAMYLGILAIALLIILIIWRYKTNKKLLEGFRR